MERQHWLGRSKAALALAHAATSAEARLIHFDMAGRYDLKASLAAGGPLFIETVRP